MTEELGIRLRHLLDHQRTMVIMADTKNAAIVAFSAACVAGLMRYSSESIEHLLVSIFLIIAIIIFSLSALLGIFSFIPRLQPYDNLRKGVVYFGDLSDGVNYHSLIQALKGEALSADRMGYYQSLAHQVVEVARIVKYKMYCSSAAFKCLMCGIVPLALVGVSGVLYEII